MLERVLRRNPDHPEQITTTSMPWRLQKSEVPPSAQPLGALMPGAGHLVHMPSHIFLRVGDYEASAAVNVIAAAVDKKYIRVVGPGMYPLTCTTA